ncbi:MAG: ArsI/CadI family heavy metal resistance metalloenzyme [Acetobacteraceae bacterium]|nr:ArsI/CadI family heavy metal resistance metalloenzyme [Acetobacteraceae bacterium]
MKRMHVNLSVEEIGASVRFYTGLFGVEPTVLKPDYAKWMLDDPRVNFAIAARGRQTGLDHLGIQVESSEELAEVYGRLKAAGGPPLEQGNVTCCYAQSEKSWITDPQGVAWEAFLTHGESTIYGDGTGEVPGAKAEATSACCAPSRAPAATAPATSRCAPAATA